MQLLIAGNHPPRNERGVPESKKGGIPDTEEAMRKKLYSLLGRLPDRNRPVTAFRDSVTERDGIIIEKWWLDLNGLEKVPAYFVKPAGAKGRLPVVLFNHSHFGQYKVGKNELILGRKEMQDPPYAIALARLGIASFCIDAWGFGERSSRTEQDIFKEMLWKGQVMWGMMVYDNLRALDYLLTRSDVDPKRVATLGMSMGSTMAWWISALDKRIRICIDICCLTDFQELIRDNGLSRHSIYYYVPDLLNHFTTSDINALIAPRRHFGLAGRYDPLTPVAGLEIIDRNLKRVYAGKQAASNWELKIYEVPHQENEAMRKDILDYLKKWL